MCRERRDLALQTAAGAEDHYQAPQPILPPRGKGAMLVASVLDLRRAARDCALYLYSQTFTASVCGRLLNSCRATPRRHQRLQLQAVEGQLLSGGSAGRADAALLLDAPHDGR